MKKQNTLINGVAYSFADIAFKINGINISNFEGFSGIPIKSISYTDTQDTTLIHENSRYASLYAYGKRSFSGSVSFTYDSFLWLTDAVYDKTGGDKSLTQLEPVDIELTYSNKGKVVTTTLKYVKFTNQVINGSEGDANFGVACDFITPIIYHGDKTNYNQAQSFTAMLEGEGLENDNQL